jgi:integrase
MLRQRDIPVQGMLVGLLRNWLSQVRGRRLFCPVGKERPYERRIYRRLDHITQGARFEKLRPHMLRHSMRTNLYEAGVDEKVIDALLGHTTVEMGNRYRHIRNSRLKQAMTRYWEQADCPSEEKSSGDEQAG